MPLRQACLLALLMVQAFLVVGQLYVTIPLTAGIAARFGVSSEAAALTGTVFGVVYALGVLIFGPLSDRHGRRRVIVLGLAATALATALAGIAPSFGLLLAARAAQGLAASAFPAAALSLVAETLPDRQRPLGLALISFAFLGAAPLAQFLGAGIGAGFGTVMLGAAPLYALGALGIQWSADGSAGRAPAGQAPALRTRLVPLLRDPVVLAAWASALAVLFGFVAFHAGAQALNAGFDLQTLRLAGLPPLLLSFAAAALIRRRSAPFAARAGLLLSALAFGLALAGSAPLLILSSILLSAGVAIAAPGLIATLAERAENANRGLALAIHAFTIFLGASIAPPLAQILAHLGPAPLWAVPGLLSLGAALALAAGTRAHRKRPSAL